MSSASGGNGHQPFAMPGGRKSGNTYNEKSEDRLSGMGIRMTEKEIDDRVRSIFIYFLD